MENTEMLRRDQLQKIIAIEIMEQKVKPKLCYIRTTDAITGNDRNYFIK